jgi:hypothetical protein
MPTWADENRHSARYFPFLGFPWGNGFNRLPNLRSNISVNASSPQGRPVREHFLISSNQASVFFLLQLSPPIADLLHQIASLGHDAIRRSLHMLP